MQTDRSADQSPALRIELLGGFRVAVGGRLVPASRWRLRKAQSLVKLLALAPGQRLPRDEVMDLLWPDLPLQAALNNLRVTLHAARRALTPAHLVARGTTLALSPDAPPWVDVVAFEVTAAAALQQVDPALAWEAAGLYTGDLLPEDRYEDWITDRREALRRTYLGLLLELAGWEEVRGEPARAIMALERLVAHEPMHEEGHRRLMRLYAQTGRRGEALRQYEYLRAVLRRELDAEPEAASQDLYHAILAGRLPPGSTTNGGHRGTR